MKKIESKYMRMKEIQAILERTETENKALSKYQGHNGSTMINELLGDYMTDQPIRAVKEETSIGRYTLYSYYEDQKRNPEQFIGDMMQQIQDIYSALVKSTYARANELNYPREYYRGAGHSLLGKNTAGFISTTESEKEATLWATSNYRHAKNHILSYITVDADVPYSFMPHSANEDEVLISPFVEIEDDGKQSNKSTYGEYSGTTFEREYIKVHYKKPQMLSTEMMEELQAELLSNANTFSTLTDRCIELSREIEKLNDRIARIEREWGSTDAQVISLKLQCDSMQSEYHSAVTNISDYKKKFRLLMEGRCAAIEQNMEQQIDAVISPIKAAEKREREEKEQKKAQREQELSEGGKLALQIKNRYFQAGFEKNDEDFRRKQASLSRAGIPFSSPLDDIMSCIQRTRAAVNSLQYATPESVITLGQPDILSQLSENEKSNIFAVADNEYKRAIAWELLKLRSTQEIKMLEERIASKDAERIGIFGKLSGKQKQHDAAIDNMRENLRKYQEMSNAIKNNGLTHDSFSARDLMAEIKIATGLARTPEEKRQVDKLQNALTSVYIINENGIQARLQEKEQQYSGNQRTKCFFDNYRSFISESGISNRPITPIERNIASRAQKIITTCQEQNREFNQLNDLNRRQEVTRD